MEASQIAPTKDKVAHMKQVRPRSFSHHVEPVAPYLG